RELELLGPGNALAPGDDHEIRHVDAMVMQDFFRDTLVLAQNKTGGAATSKWHALHLQKRNNVLIEATVVLELIRQIKNHVGLERFQFLPEQIEIIENREMFLGMTEGAQCAQDIGFRFPILRLHFLAQVLVDLGRSNGVKKSEDFEFLLHAIWCV